MAVVDAVTERPSISEGRPVFIGLEPSGEERKSAVLVTECSKSLSWSNNAIRGRVGAKLDFPVFGSCMPGCLRLYLSSGFSCFSVVFLRDSESPERVALRNALMARDAERFHFDALLAKWEVCPHRLE